MSAAAETLPLDGPFLLSSLHDISEVKHLPSGRSQRLPPTRLGYFRSPNEDVWAASAATSELIREDGAEQIDIFAWPSMAKTGSFKLRTQLAASDRPHLSTMRMSPDGSLVAAWEYSDRRQTPMVVFDRRGEVRLYGSAEIDSFGWLPGPRLVYGKAGELFVADIAKGTTLPVAVQYPAQVEGAMAMTPSPDGKQIAVVRVTALANSRGERVDTQVLYVVGSEGGAAKPIVMPVRKHLETKGRFAFQSLGWTPDSQHVVFAVNRVGNTYAGAPHSYCPRFYAVKASVNRTLALEGLGAPAEADRAWFTPWGQGQQGACATLQVF